ncbi:MAG TPA: phosphatase PAP2 family protein [Xanthobacteraceae bacterium]|jgi:membrane-associated phospholipid phosphatase|nr:phosphatase PAP2 family protein [Xanthobacteraceae bacterium]
MNDPQSAARRVSLWLMWLALVAAFCLVSYAWFDRPIAFFVHRELGQPFFLTQLPRISEWLVGAASAVFVLLGLRGLTGRPLSRLEAVILLCGLSIIVSAAVKGEMKLIFGRTWPETWTNNNPSLVRDGVYGFHFFHGGRGYESFPSGHTAAVCAAMMVLWLCYPRWRALYAVVVGLVIIGLIGSDFHFLSDVVAGGFVGASTGWLAMLMWQAGGPRQITDDG